MRDADHRQGPFPSRLPTQVDAAALGHDVFDVHAGVGGHLHARHDTRNCGVFRCGLERDERLPTLGEGRTFHEIELPSRATVLVSIDEFRIHLPIEIDLNGGIYAHHVVVLFDYMDVVDVRRSVAFHGWVIVDEVIDLVIAHSECKNMLSRVHSFLAPVDHAAFHQSNKGMAEKLGMDTQVIVVRKIHGHGVRQITDAQLQRGTIRDLLGDTFANF